MGMGAGSTLKVPKWPHVHQLQQWLIQLGKNLVSVSTLNDMAEIKWLQEVKTKTFEDLADSGANRFQKMDIKMATEMQSAYKDADGALRLMQEIQILDEDITNKGGMIKGRQYVKLIMEHFKTDRSLDQAWQIEDLFSMEYPGDHRLTQFRYLWYKIVFCLKGEINLEQLRKLLRRRLGHSKVLKEDIAHYDRQEGVEGSKDHTYEYLLDSIDRYLKRVGIQQNQQEHEKIFDMQMKALKDGKNLTPAQLTQQLHVVPAKGKERGKDSKGKGKGKHKGEPAGEAWNRNRSPEPEKQVCWHHNCKHHYPDSGAACQAKLDENGKSMCWFSHHIVSRKEFDNMAPPRSVGKAGSKGGAADGKSPKGGGRRDARSPGPASGMKYCYDFAKTGTCKNGENCWFGHISPTQLAKMGINISPADSKGNKKGDSKGKKVVAAESQGATVGCAPRSLSEVTSTAVEQIHRQQDEAAEVFAAGLEL